MRYYFYKNSSSNIYLLEKLEQGREIAGARCILALPRRYEAFDAVDPLDESIINLFGEEAASDG